MLNFRCLHFCLLFFGVIILGVLAFVSGGDGIALALTTLGVGGLVFSSRAFRDFKKNEVEVIKARHSSEAKSRFLANMSHEIRTPLGSIMGFAKLLENKELSHEERLKYLKIIYKAGENLTEVINDILDISKIESGHFHLDYGDMHFADFLSDLKKILEPHCLEKKVLLHFQVAEEFPETVRTDSVRLRQVLLNLLGNAIKFTEEGEVWLKASRDGENLVFDIEDTGIGISKENQEKIFNPFEQGDSVYTKTFGGTGLGIPLSKHLAQLLGGDLRLVWSMPGMGSHFQVKVAYVQASSALRKNSGKPAPKVSLSVRGMKVLTVDDSEDSRCLIELMLRKKGCEVELAKDGREALLKISRSRFDVVLMDMQMPVMNGVEAVKELRSRGINIPVVALTACAMEQDAKKCMEAGFSGYLSKPVEFDVLIQTLGRFEAPRRSLDL